MKKVLKAFALLIPPLIAVGIEFVVAIFGIIIYYQVYMTEGLYSWFILKDKSRDIYSLISNLPYPSDTLIEYMSYMMQIMWIVLFFFWYQYMKKERSDRKLPLLKVKNIVLIVVLSIGYNIATGGLLELILPYFGKLMEQYSKLMETLFEGNPVLIFISVVILAPLSEELIFRGVVLQKALRFAPFLVANILQALLFGLIHMNIVQGIYAFAGGLAMGYVAYKFKTIWASILMHAVYNGLGYVLTDPTEQWMVISYLVIGLVLVAVSVRLLGKAGAKQRNLTETIN